MRRVDPLVELPTPAAAHRWASLMFRRVLWDWAGDIRTLRRTGLDRPSFRRGPAFANDPDAVVPRARSASMFPAPSTLDNP